MVNCTSTGPKADAGNGTVAKGSHRPTPAATAAVVRCNSARRRTLPDLNAGAAAPTAATKARRTTVTMRCMTQS